ncbi:YfhO family protein [Agrococcus jejuensis]|uniref:YfhO family protein n=1 Tax=Agrococcus jejuensis TaxID=399736 RepID=UPI0011A02736|nr:YfhO family protein [Agrococcus jejuensis]
MTTDHTADREHPQGDGSTAGPRDVEPTSVAATAGAGGAAAATPGVASAGSATTTAPVPAAERGRQPGRVGLALDRAQERVGSAVGRGMDAVGGSRAGRWFQRTEQPGLVDWLLLGAIVVFSFVTFLYADVRATFDHSLNLLDAIFAGRVQDFYQIAIDQTLSGHPAVYDVPVYLVFAIWNLPTWIIVQLTGLDYMESVPALLWAKAMMVFFLAVAAKAVVDIARTAGLTRQRSRWVGFFLVSSMAAFVPVLVVVQYDVISVAFMLLGIHAYMRGRTRSFLLWFLAANTLKLFAVFVFIPLILLREKRVIPAAGQLVVGMLGLVACKLLYRGDLAYEISTGRFTDDMLDRLLYVGFDWHSGITASLFVGLMVGLVIFAYAKRVADDRERIAFAIYIPLVAFLGFCVLVPINPYWMMLAAPFSVLIIFLNPRFLVLNTLLETFTGLALIAAYTLLGWLTYGGIIEYLLFGQLVPRADPQRWYSVQDMWPGDVTWERVPFLVAFAITCFVATLVLNYPRRAFLAGMPNVERIPRSVVLVRLGVLASFLALIVATYVVPARAVAYSSASPTVEPVPDTTDLLLPGNVVEQEMVFADDIAVTRMEIGFDAGEVVWVNVSALHVELLASDGTAVYTGTAPVNTLEVGVTPFDTGDLVLEAGETYTLRLTADENDEGGQVLVQLNPEQDSFVTTANGVVIPGDIVLVLDGATR